MFNYVLAVDMRCASIYRNIIRACVFPGKWIADEGNNCVKIGKYLRNQEGFTLFKATLERILVSQTV